MEKKLGVPASRVHQLIRQKGHSAGNLIRYATATVEAPLENGSMSTHQNQPPYQQPYQPHYQTAPPYGQQRPRATHTGKLVVAIILFIIGPLLGLFIAGIGSVIVAASIATGGDIIANGQQVKLSDNEERTLYVQEDTFASTCTVVAPDGEEVPTSHSAGMKISHNSDFISVLTFKADKAGDYRVSCESLDDTDTVLVGPTLTFSKFMVPLVAGLAVGVICWIIAIILLIRRHRALAAQTQAG
jgi:hypothetical protein avisC_04097